MPARSLDRCALTEEKSRVMRNWKSSCHRGQAIPRKHSRHVVAHLSVIMSACVESAQSSHALEATVVYERTKHWNHTKRAESARYRPQEETRRRACTCTEPGRLAERPCGLAVYRVEERGDAVEEGAVFGVGAHVDERYRREDHADVPCTPSSPVHAGSGSHQRH